MIRGNLEMAAGSVCCSKRGVRESLPWGISVPTMGHREISGAVGVNGRAWGADEIVVVGDIGLDRFRYDVDVRGQVVARSSGHLIMIYENTQNFKPLLDFPH